jgi:hypothetical protein
MLIPRSGDGKHLPDPERPSPAKSVRTVPGGKVACMSGHVALQMPSDDRPLSPLGIEGLVNRKQPSRIVNLTVDIPSSHQPHTADTAPRWKTPEFFFYYVMFIAVVPIMVWTPVALSSREYTISSTVIEFRQVSHS